MSKRIALVAGEASGDIIGAGLIGALKQRLPDAEFFGIAGPRMIAAGCRALFPAEALSVMGLFEVLAHLKEILSIRTKLYEELVRNPPDVFIGIDAPDFNLGLERRLRHQGIRTVHYVSPSVWAWRQKRVHKIREAVDLMLTLFPFEEAFYHRHDVPAEFVGHPLADIIEMKPDRLAARQALGLSLEGNIIALLPGSRNSEVKRLGKIFLQTAVQVRRQVPDIHFIAPMANASTRAILRYQAARFPDLPLDIINGDSRKAMMAADAVLLASGTAALEAMLLKRPMVVAYRLSPMTYAILKGFRVLKVSHYSLPNLLAGKAVVPEFIQSDARPDNLAAALVAGLDESEDMQEQIGLYHEIHKNLRQNASYRAAEAIVRLMQEIRA